jgi:nitric oxide reductase subunit B
LLIGSKTGLNHFFFYSAITIPLFYASGLMYPNHTPVSLAEYWRWWVVHLWVSSWADSTVGWVKPSGQ